jgi:hypothetical protein
MKIDHNEIIDTNFYSISGRMAAIIEEALHRNRTILHTSITARDDQFFGSIIWKEVTRLSYLNFVEQPNPGKLTKVWYVYSTTEPGGRPLGVILYRPGWRKYVFAPGEAIFDAGCLTDIVNFLILRRRGRLWFFSDMSMYVYYDPTHWKPILKS